MQSECTLCDGPATLRKAYRDDVYLVWDCERCGGYDCSNVAANLIESDFRQQRYLLSGLTREATLGAQRAVALTTENVTELVTGAPLDVPDRIDRLLLALAAMSTHGGEVIKLEAGQDYPLGYCRNAAELRFFFDELEKGGWVERPRGSTTQGWLSTAGWSRVRDLRKSSASSIQAFVAMSFSPELRGLYGSAIQPAILEAGYRPLRLDFEEHSDRIDDRILAEIKRSRFVVCDFTENKHGVYFEAGYAMGLGIPIIWTCRSKPDIDQLHFDTRQFNHIDWHSEPELRERLLARIRVIIG
jgi:hypothetical protein